MNNHILHNLDGEQKDQLLIVVDKNGKKMGTATREKCHTGEGKTHLAFMAFVKIRGKIVLTKRAERKSLWAGHWDASVVSHVLSGETVEEAAHRRGKEELGVEVNFKNLGAFYYFARHGNGVENEYCHVLAGNTSDEIIANPVEIDETEEISTDELKKRLKQNPKDYTPWLILTMEKYGYEI